MAIQPKGKKVTGTKKKDKITWTSSKPWKTNLTVKAGAGNDAVNFSKSTSKLKHKIYGESGNDTIKGGKGKDTIDGGTGSDKIYGNAGNDVLKGGKGNDYIDGGSGNDKIYGQYNTNKLKGGSGNDSIYSGTGTDSIWGGAGNDYINLSKGGKNVVYGEAGKDKIVSIKGNSNVDGGADNDTITAVSGNNTLKGGSGNDSITGGTGTDYITGGTGNDTIVASKGINIVNIAKGDGHDKIVDAGLSNGLTLNLGSDIELLIGYQSGTDYVIEKHYAGDVIEYTTLQNFDFNTSKDKVTVNYNGAASTLGAINFPDYDPENPPQFRNVSGEFVADLEKNYIIFGSADADNITTNSGNDVIRAGEGNNNITTSGGNNTITTGSGDDDITVNGTGTNTIEIAGGNNTVTVKGSDNTITTGAGNDNITLNGSAKNNVNMGAGENTVNINSTGSNTVSSGSGADTFNINAGTNNVITTGGGADVVNVSGGTNTIDMTGTNGATLTVTGGESTINGGSGVNTWDLQGGKTNITMNQPEGSGDLEVTISGGSHTIKGSENVANKVTITGGSNHDITTGVGKDVVSITGGSGAVDAGGFDDEIYINGSASGVIVYGGKGQDEIVVGYDNGAFSGNVTVYGGERPSENAQYTGSDTKSNSMNIGTKGQAEIWAGNGEDTIGDYINAGYSKDSEYYGNYTIHGGSNNDIINADSSSHATIDGGAGNDTIQAGHNGQNSIDGGEGNDTINAYGNNNTVYGGIGQDTISVTTSTSGTNYIYGGEKPVGDAEYDGTDNASNNISAGNKANNEIWAGNGVEVDDGNGGTYIKGDTIRVGTSESENYFGNNTVHGGAGRDSIDAAYSSHATIDGGAGNDSIVAGHNGQNNIDGGEGNDTIYTYGDNNKIYGGSGKDTIYVYNSESGRNTIYGGAKPEGDAEYDGTDDNINRIEAANKSNNLIYAGNGIQDTREVSDYYDYEQGSYVYKQVQYQKGDTINAGYNENENYYGNNEIHGGKGYDYINAYSSNQSTIYGGEGNDTIYGGHNGNSSLYGGEGDDDITAYGSNNEIYGGSGRDFININNSESGTNTIYGGSDTLGTDDEANNIDARNKANNVIWAGNGITKTVQDSWDYDTHQPTYEQKNFGDTITVGKAESIYEDDPENPGAQIYVRTDYFGDNTVHGGKSNDSITASDSSHATIYGGDGNDTIQGASNGQDDKNNYIDGGEGNDKVTIYGGYNNVYGGNGNDYIYLSDKDSSNNTIYGGTDSSGTDDGWNQITLLNKGNNTIYAGNGVEVDDGEGGTYIKGDIIQVGASEGVYEANPENPEEQIHVGTNYFGNNTIYGGDGRDSIDADSSSHATIYGGEGNDSITTGRNGENYVEAGEGNDRVTIYGGGNEIYGDTGNDYIYTGDENGTNNTIYGGTNASGTDDGWNEITVQNKGNNTIYAGNGALDIRQVDDYYDEEEGRWVYKDEEYLRGDDISVGWSDGTNYFGENLVYGGDGDDNIDASYSRHATIYGGEGDDYIYGGGNGGSSLVGGEDDDEIVGYGAGNTIEGGVGNDSIYMSKMADGTNTIYGGNGNDYISIDSGNDTDTTNYIYGGTDSNGTDNGSNEIVVSTKSSAEIWAGNGVDDVRQVEVIDPETGDYVYDDETGEIVYEEEHYLRGDHIDIGRRESTYDEEQGRYVENYYGQGTVHGGAGEDYINAEDALNVTIDGGDNNDSITGARLSSSINGGAGNDSIYVSGTESNAINGGEGEDYIYINSNVIADVTGGTDNDNIDINNNNSTVNLHFNQGDGNDTIYNCYNKTDATHTLYFDDTDIENITAGFTTDGDLIISYGTQGDSVKLSGFGTAGDPNTSVKFIQAQNMAEPMSILDFVNTHSNYQAERTLDGSGNVNEFTGTYYNETIYGGDLADKIDGNYGNDSLYGGAGNDTLYDIYGNNTIEGGKGNDEIDGYSEEGANTIIFNVDDDGYGDGTDKVNYADSYDTLKFAVNSFNDIDITYNYKTRALELRYTDHEEDKVIIDYISDSYNRETTKIGLVNSDVTKTIQELLEERHLYLPDGADYHNSQTITGSNSEEYGDKIYLDRAGYTTIIGGKGNDTITILGDDENEDGKIDNVYNVNYFFDATKDGGTITGDGQDVIVNSNTRDGDNSYICFTGVGTGYDDYDAQDAFIKSLVFRTNEDGDLIIEYGTEGSKITIKGYNPESPKSAISTISFAYPDGNGGYDYGHSYNLNYSDNMRITYDAQSTTINGAAYSQIINGTEGDDTITPGLGSNIINPNTGADVIKFNKHYEPEQQYNYETGEYYYEDRIQELYNTLNMGTDTVADTLWFEDVTSKEQLHAYRSGNNLIIEARDNEDYTVYDVVNNDVTLKDYFKNHDPNGNPTYMNIKIGNGEGIENNFTLADIISSISIDNEDKLATVNGTVFKDYIYTQDDTDELVTSGKGNDTINPNRYGDNSADTIKAGAGDDSIDYSGNRNSATELYGEDGNDRIEIHNGTVYGGNGNDSITVSWNGNATIYGGNKLSIEDSADYQDTIEGNDGDDSLIGSIGKDSIYGGSGDDTITGGGNNDTLIGGAGNDIITGGSAADTIDGDSGSDTIYAGGGADLIFTSDRYYLEYNDPRGHSTNGEEEVHAGAGDDTIYVQSYGKNEIWGDEGNDEIISSYYSESDYHFKKGDGNDTISTSPANYGYEDRIVFDDLDFEDDIITAELDLVNNKMIIRYNKVDDEFKDSITINDYLEQHEDYAEDVNGDYIKYTDVDAGVHYVDADVQHYSFVNEEYVEDPSGNYIYDEYYDEYYELAEGRYSKFTYYETDSSGDINTSLRVLVDKNGKEVELTSLITNAPVEYGTDDEEKQTIFNDHITLTGDKNYARGSMGDDTLIGNSTTGSQLYGDDGNDSLEGSSDYNNYLYGGWGNDTLLGGTEDDYMSGDEGDDKLYGGAGDDTLYGGEGNDLLRGGAGDDTIYGSDGNDTLIGVTGANKLDGGAGDDSIVSGTSKYTAGDFSVDTIYGGAGSNIYDIQAAGNSSGIIAEIHSESGTDTIKFDSSIDDPFSLLLSNSDLIIKFGTYYDSVKIVGWKQNPVDFRLEFTDATVESMLASFSNYYESDDVDFVSGNNNHTDSDQLTLFGTTNADTITTDASADTGQNRWVYAGAGNDSITVLYSEFGGNCESTVYGAEGNDTIIAQGDYEMYVDGGNGDDSIICGDGNNTIYGGEGNDKISSGNGGTMIDGGNGNDEITVTSTYGANTIFGGLGADVIDTSTSTTDNIIVTSFRPDNDTMNEIFEDLNESYYDWKYEQYEQEAGNPDNIVTAGSGNDTIYAVGENSSLNGGEGNDTYHVTDSNNTIITDNAGANSLVLHNMINSWTDMYTYMNIKASSNVTIENIDSVIDGDIYISEYHAKDDWMYNGAEFTDGSYAKITLKDGIHTIDSYTNQQGYTLTSAQMAIFVQDVAGWLCSGGRNYDDVADVFGRDDNWEDQGTLRAMFNKTGNTYDAETNPYGWHQA